MPRASDANLLASTPTLVQSAKSSATACAPVVNNSAANMAAATQPAAQMAAAPGEWAQAHTPAVDVQATTTKAAGGAGVRHVCRMIAFSHDAVAAQTAIQINLRDGATGAGTILFSLTVKLAIGTTPQYIVLSGLNIFGSANTAMTLEFSAAPVATNTQSVSMSGYSTA